MIMKYILKNSRTGKDINEFLTTLEIQKTDKKLIFDFVCKNSKFYSAYDKYNEPIYEGDVCEAFICTGTDITKYYEIEVAPNNVLFVNRMKCLGVGEYEADPIPEEENFVTSKVEILNDTDYRVTFIVPLEKIGYDEKIGIRFNAYRIETEGGFTDKNLLAVSPTMCDSFHQPASFIELK